MSAIRINFCIPVFPKLGASLTELPIPGKRIVTIRVPYHSTLFILDFSFQRSDLLGLRTNKRTNYRQVGAEGRPARTRSRKRARGSPAARTAACHARNETDLGIRGGMYASAPNSRRPYRLYLICSDASDSDSRRILNYFPDFFRSARLSI